MNKVMTIQPYNGDGQNVPTLFDNKQLEILKNSICKGVSDDEFQIFIMACQKTGLDPFMKQIYAVKRKAKKADGTWGESMTIQTGIDGYRVIAERTGCYAPGVEPTYQYDEQGNLVSATAYVKKQTRDGTWHTVAASAHIDEYMQTFVDKQTGEKKPTGLWVNMPKTMLAKCAESQALRKAFPAEMSGVYTKEEMTQADVIMNKISLEQAADLQMILDECDPNYQELVLKILRDKYHSETLADIPLEMFDRLKTAANKNRDEYITKQKANFKQPELIAEEVQ